MFSAGHKCGFAAAEKTPCPQHEFNSFFKQTTCQECDIGLGEKCHTWERDNNQPIIGLSHIIDVLAANCYDKNCIARHNRFMSSILVEPIARKSVLTIPNV